MFCCSSPVVEEDILRLHYAIGPVLGKGRFAVVNSCSRRSTGGAQARVERETLRELNCTC
jgi:hypothetical protein